MIVSRDTPLEPRAPLMAAGSGLAFVLPASAFTLEGFNQWFFSGSCPRHGRFTYADGTVFVEDELRQVGFQIPRSALSPGGFRNWATSSEYPPVGRVEFLDGDIYIDMNAESVDTHARLKFEITRVVGNLIVEQNLGYFFPDGVLIVHQAAQVSNLPDAMFCSYEALKTGRVKQVQNKRGEVQSVEGSVDWVLEIVSNSSIEKDTKILKRNYFRAGFREYWLIDARRGEIDFQIYSPGKKGFERNSRRGGWIESPVFQQKFSLQIRDYDGFWRWDLRMAPPAKK